eukprot:gene2801-4209_t
MDKKFIQKQINNLTKRAFSNVQGNFRRVQMLNFIKQNTTRSQNRVRVIDASQRSPVYESPYEGPREIKKLKSTTSPLDFLYVTDDYQKEWIVDIDQPHRTTGDIFLEFIYLLGILFFGLYTYIHLFSSPAWIHPMARTNVSKDELKKADEKIQERKENMKKYEIDY